MIDWEAVAKRLGYADERGMWSVLYAEKELSLAALSSRLGVGQRTIRAALVRCEFKIRSRGRPRRFTLAEVRQIQKEGIGKAAKRLGLSYWAVYKRLRQSEEEGGHDDE